MKIGLFGGTFDPIHDGHLAMAKAAIDGLALDRVLFIPVYQPPHKSRTALTHADHRVAMIEQAIAQESCMQVSRIEVEQATTSYSYQSVQRLRQQYPEAAFYFLIGADNVEGLGSWRELDYLLAEVTFVAFQRPGHQLETPYPVHVLEFADYPVSSTAIRNFSRYQYVPKPVLDYMLAQKLYGLTIIHAHVANKMTRQRFIHTMGVVETAIQLAERYGLNRQQCQVSALLHDYAKGLSKQQLQVLMAQYFSDEPFIAPIAHANVGSILIQSELCITDPVVIDAVRYHTTGHPDMDAVAQCIFLADYIEPNRNFPGVVEAREQANISLDTGVAYAVQQTNQYLRHSGKSVHVDSQALENKLFLGGTQC